jgi:hypothetical protein
MFNNASVIFRTRFVDGVSAVERTVAGAKMKSSITAAAASAAFEQCAPKKKRTRVWRLADVYLLQCQQGLVLGYAFRRVGFGCCVF